MSLLGVMSGISSLRGLAGFVKRHEKEAQELFELPKAKLPTCTTIRQMSQRVDAESLTQAFCRWAQKMLPVEEGEGVAIDGKALASTVSDNFGHQQDFVSVVNACVQEHGWVIGQTSFQNGSSSEIVSVRELLARRKFSRRSR